MKTALIACLAFAALAAPAVAGQYHDAGVIMLATNLACDEDVFTDMTLGMVILLAAAEEGTDHQMATLTMAAEAVVMREKADNDKAVCAIGKTLAKDFE